MEGLITDRKLTVSWLKQVLKILPLTKIHAVLCRLELINLLMLLALLSDPEVYDNLSN